MRVLLALLLALPLAARAQAVAPWQMEPSETTADLRGVHAVGGGVVWASGSGGTVLRSQDSGFEWQVCATPPGAEKLDFRAIWAWDDQTAVVMSSGLGALSRLYKTTDGCAHWTLLYTNPDKDGFWDGIAFSDRNNGYLLGDPIGGQLLLEWTEDGGHAWKRMQSQGLNVGARGAFAASNSSISLPGLSSFGGRSGPIEVPSIGTSGPGGALVLDGEIVCTMMIAHEDPDSCVQGMHFSQATVPIEGISANTGVFSLATRSNAEQQWVVAVGGDYSRPQSRAGTAAWTGDGGLHWTASAMPPGGYRSAVAWDADLNLWIAAGPNGSDLSRDDGRTWQPVERAPTGTPKGGEWNALSLPWAVGPHGRIGKLNPSALRIAPAASR